MGSPSNDRIDMASFLHHFSNFILPFGQTPAFILLFVVGYIWIDRHLFFQGFLLLCTSMLLNCVLKLGFKVPLKAHLGEGYAFPSGHMQSSMVVHTWLLFHTKHQFFVFIFLFLILSLGFSLNYCNYHTHGEIFAGMMVGLLWVILCWLLMRKNPSGWIFLVIGALFLGIILLQSPNKKILSHGITVFFTMAGWLLGNHFFPQGGALNFWQKMLASILIFGFFLAFYKIIYKNGFCQWPFDVQLPFFCAPMLWIIMGAALPALVYGLKGLTPVNNFQKKP